MKFPTIAGQDVDRSDERSMQVHERMLWMRTRDETVGGEESNMQKVRPLCQGSLGLGDTDLNWTGIWGACSASWRTFRISSS